MRRAQLFLFLFANAIGVMNVQAAELGRLFFTPMQRMELDRKRVLPAQSGEQEKVATPDLTINGRISASSGRTTTWVNGVPNYDGSVPNRNAKVGETIDPATGEVKDGLEGGKLVIKPAR